MIGIPVDEHGIPGNDGGGLGREYASLEIGKHVVGSRAAAVAHDQDAVVFLGREPSLFRLAAASEGCANPSYVLVVAGHSARFRPPRVMTRRLSNVRFRSRADQVADFEEQKVPQADLAPALFR
jgi:hypothetical protein